MYVYQNHMYICINMIGGGEKKKINQKITFALIQKKISLILFFFSFLFLSAPFPLHSVSPPPHLPPSLFFHMICTCTYVI